MSKRDNALLLGDMHEAAIKIKTYIAGYTFSDFTNDEKTIDAVIRNLEIIVKLQIELNRNSKLRIPKSHGINYVD